MQFLSIGSLLDRQPWLFVPFYILFWCAICLLIGQTSGWMRVARAFPADHVPQGMLVRWRTLLFGNFTHYGNCINVILSSEGIYMVPALMFKLGHPSILLPWSCVKEITTMRGLKPLLKVSLEADGKRMTLFMPERIDGDLERLSRRKITPLVAPQERTQTQTLR